MSFGTRSSSRLFFGALRRVPPWPCLLFLRLGRCSATREQWAVRWDARTFPLRHGLNGWLGYANAQGAQTRRAKNDEVLDFVEP